VRWQVAGIRVGDFIVAVGDVDVKWSRHDQVVAMIRRSGIAIRLGVVTPIDRNFIDPDAAPACPRPGSARSARTDPVPTDPVPDTATDSRSLSRRERTPEIPTPTLARHWGFRRRRKRDKTGQ